MSIRNAAVIGLILVLALVSCGKPSDIPSDNGPAEKGGANPAGKPIFEDRDSLALRPFRGKIVVLELGCVGCPGSEEMYKSLLGMRQEFGSNAEFIRVDFKQTVEQNRGYYETNPPSFHIIGDPDGKIGMSLKSQAMPTLYLYGKWGLMRYAGLLKPDDFKAMTDALLAETKPDKKNYFLEKKGPVKGSGLIDFTLPDISGIEVTLDEFRQGIEVFVLVFGGTSCPTSRNATQKLGNLSKTLDDERLAMLLVNLGSDVATVKSIYEPMDLPFPVLVDQEEKVADRYGIDAVPTVFVMGADGKVALRSLWNAEAVTQEVEILLGRINEEDREEFEQEGEG
ncbi:MAG: TlpA family protein disulfide reductase [Planctomycetota bacterium]